MAFNIFSKRKKPLNQSQNQNSSQARIQGSGYGSNYASNASNYQAPRQPAVKASTYSTPNYLSSLTKQPTIQTRQQPQQTQQSTARPAPTPYKPPQTLPWGTNTGILPWGQKQPQTATPRVQGPQSRPRAVGPMSVAPKQNMSVDPNAGRYQAPAPTPQPQAQPQVDPSQNWMKYISNAGQNRIGTENNRLQDQLEFLRAQGQLNNQQLLEQIPVAQENFNQFKGNTEASIADLIAGGERQKDQTSDYYGDAQRQAALARRDVQGQTQRTFAGLGTLDSRGEGSFAQETANQDSEFNRFTQQNLKAKADQLAEIDMTVRTAERNARATIAQEEQKMNQLSRDIQYAVANNDLTTAQGLKEAYSQSQQYVYDIEDSLAQTKYQFGLQQQELENDLAKVQSFTPEFMATGQPTNQAEFEFFVKNKEAFGGSDGLQDLDDKGKIAANGLDVLADIRNYIQSDPGVTRSLNPLANRSYKSSVNNMSDIIGRLRSGGAINEQEEKSFKGLLPTFADDTQTIERKLGQLENELRIRTGSGYQGQGTFVPGADISSLAEQFGG